MRKKWMIVMTMVMLSAAAVSGCKKGDKAESAETESVSDAADGGEAEGQPEDGEEAKDSQTEESGQDGDSKEKDGEEGKGQEDSKEQKDGEETDTAETEAVYTNPWEALSFKTMGEFSTNTKTLCPLAESADGDYIYAGFLEGEGKGVYKIAKSNGMMTPFFFTEGYCKGIAVDNRNNVFIGISEKADEDAAYVYVLDGENSRQVSMIDIRRSGKLGINGMAVYQNDDIYKLYLITNHETNSIYCYDITYPAAPYLDSGFGRLGRVDLVDLTGTESCSALYLAVDEGRNLYVTANLGMGERADTVMKIASDGQSILQQTELKEGCGITIANDCLLVSTFQDGKSAIEVLDIADFTHIASIPGKEDATCYTGVLFDGSKVYVSDQSYNDGSRLLVSSALSKK